jgi:hypothetical protein
MFITFSASKEESSFQIPPFLANRVTQLRVCIVKAG